MWLTSILRLLTTGSRRTSADRLRRRAAGNRRASFRLTVGHLEHRSLPSGFSTYLGGSDADEGYGIAVDAAGNTYVVGSTASSDFPATIGSLNGSYDVFVAKFGPDGSLGWAGLYGGSINEFPGSGIALDGAGNLYLTGDTGSDDFPTTPGAFQETKNGPYSSAFVLKLDTETGAIVYSTYLGSSDGTVGEAVAVDASGNIYVTGMASSGFPTTAGAAQPTHAGSGDGFVAKLTADGSAMVYSTYLGGSGSEVYGGRGIAVDASGNAYVTGLTFSTDFPTTAGALQTSAPGGIGDGFVTKLNETGTAFDYSTYLGGADEDWGHAIAVDADGNAYVTGRTLSADFPTTAGAFDTTAGGEADAYLIKLNADGSAPVYSTYLGGGEWDEGRGVVLDGTGNAYVTGPTSSAGFPTTADAFDTTLGGNSDAFVTEVDAAGSGLVYSTYLGGGGGYESGVGIARDGVGNVYATGYTEAADFPTTAGAFDTTFNGTYDAFVTRLQIGLDSISVTIDQAAGQVDPTAGPTVSFDVVFAAPVTEFDPLDIDFTGSTVGGTLAAEVTGSGANYTVTVTGMTGVGTVVASIPAGAAVGPAGLSTLASTSTDNSVTFDGVVPTVTVEQAAGQADPTTGGPIHFTVAFTEPVLGFDGSDILFTGSTVGGTLSALVTATGATTYDVAVSGMTDEGNVIATIPAAAATDQALNTSTASTSDDNTVAFDALAPTVTINKTPVQGDPTSQSPITFDVVFSEPVTGFTDSDVDLTASAAGGPLTAVVSGSGAVYTVTVTGMSSRGNVVASIGAGAAADLAGNLSLASTSTDNSVEFLNAGAVTLSVATVTTDEGQTLQITASRVGGTEGVVSFEFAVDGRIENPLLTATTGADFTVTPPVSLTWGEGESDNKVFEFVITNDSTNEGKETFTLTLTNPTGGLLLGATPSATVTIAPSDGALINGAAVRPQKPSAVFQDAAGLNADNVTVTLGGKVGTATVFLTDPDGDGRGPIELIRLDGTDPAKSTLTIGVKKPRGSTGDARTQLAEVTGTAGAGLKSLTALTTDMSGPGINLSGFLSTLKLGNISGGADITVAAPTATMKRPAMRITAGMIGGGTDITIPSAPIAAPLASLTAITVGDGTITAPSVGTLTAKGKAKTKLAAAIPGDFEADVVVSGVGILPTKNAVTKIRAAGTMSGNVTVTGNVGTISVGTRGVGDLTGDVTVSGNLNVVSVAGKADGVLIDVGGNVKVASFGQFWNSRLDAGYTGPSNGSGTFDFESTIGTFKVSSKTNGFARSDVVAANFRNVALASVDPAVTGTKFGFAYHTSLRALMVSAPAFRFDPAGAVVQGLGSSDFEVRKA